MPKIMHTADKLYRTRHNGGTEVKRLLKKWFVICVFVFVALSAAESVYADASINVQTWHTGNIYNDRDNKTMTIKYEDSADQADATAYFEIKNEKSEVLWSDSTGKSLSAGEETALSLPDLGYGAFYLKIAVKDQENNLLAEKEIPYSVILERKDGRLNDKVGVNAHFSWGWNVEKGCEVARKAGFSIIRDELTWQQSEPRKGEYIFPKRHYDIIDTMLKEGIEPQYNFLFGNTLYNMEEKFVLPETDEQINAFAEYAYNIVKNSQGKIKYFRVWNEPNHPEKNQTQDRAELYMKLLKKVYTRIKPDFPEVQIGAFTTTDIKRSVEFIKWACDSCDSNENPAQYFDYVSVHHYNTPKTLSDDDFKALRTLIDSYGGRDKEIWCNEYGFYDDTATDWGEPQNSHTKAAYTSVLTAQMLVNKYADKCLIYALADKSAANLTVAENVFGLTKSFDSEVAYAAKPAYVSVAAFNSLTCGYKECGTTSYTEAPNVRQFDFRKTDDLCDVSMLWSVGGKQEISINPNKNDNKRNIIFRDMYGNIIVPKEDGRVSERQSDGTYLVTVSDEDPIYVIYQPDEEPTYFVYQNDRFNSEIICIDKATNRFRISGRVIGGGELVCAVYPTEKLPTNSNTVVPSQDMAYCTQLDTGRTGWFSAEFSLTDEYEYFTAVIANKNLNEKYLIKFSTIGFTANITATNKDENRFKLSGTVIGGGDLVCAVYPTEKLPSNSENIIPTQDMVYCNQLDVDRTGEFSVEFSLTDEYEHFTAVVANENIKEKYLISFNGRGVIYNIITVKQNDKDNINEIKDIDKNKSIDVTVINYNVFSEEKPSLICVAYNTDGQVIDCKTPELETTGNIAEAKDVKINTSEAAAVKVYLWNMKNLCPLGEFKSID